MAKPDNPRDTGEQAPKSAPSENMKMLIISSIMTICICGVFVVTNYFIQETILTKKLNAIIGSESTTEETQTVNPDERGIIMDLGDFILNLSDVSPRRYLKVNVAIELSKTDADREIEASASKGGGGGHGGHGEGAPAADPQKAIEAEMSQYKPALRDAIISTLSSKTSDELLSTSGKELAKEQISQNIDAIFEGEREVLRVSFGQFIIQ